MSFNHFDFVVFVLLENVDLLRTLKSVMLDLPNQYIFLKEGPCLSRLLGAYFIPLLYSFRATFRTCSWCLDPMVIDSNVL